jgi:ankyrin repeat protein
MAYAGAGWGAGTSTSYSDLVETPHSIFPIISDVLLTHNLPALELLMNPLKHHEIPAGHLFRLRQREDWRLTRLTAWLFAECCSETLTLVDAPEFSIDAIKQRLDTRAKDQVEEARRRDGGVFNKKIEGYISTLQGEFIERDTFAAQSLAGEIEKKKEIIRDYATQFVNANIHFFIWHLNLLDLSKVKDIFCKKLEVFQALERTAMGSTDAGRDELTQGVDAAKKAAESAKETLDRLFQEHQVDPSKFERNPLSIIDDRGNTPLHVALFLKDEAAVRYLMSRLIHSETPTHETLLAFLDQTNKDGQSIRSLATTISPAFLNELELSFFQNPTARLPIVKPYSRILDGYVAPETPIDLFQLLRVWQAALAYEFHRVLSERIVAQEHSETIVDNRILLEIHAASCTDLWATGIDRFFAHAKRGRLELTAEQRETVLPILKSYVDAFILREQHLYCALISEHKGNLHFESRKDLLQDLLLLLPKKAEEYQQQLVEAGFSAAPVSLSDPDPLAIAIYAGEVNRVKKMIGYAHAMSDEVEDLVQLNQKFLKHFLNLMESETFASISSNEDLLIIIRDKADAALLEAEPLFVCEAGSPVSGDRKQERFAYVAGVYEVWLNNLTKLIDPTKTYIENQATYLAFLAQMKAQQSDPVLGVVERGGVETIQTPLSIVDNKGNTALHLALLMEQVEISVLLIQTLAATIDYARLGEIFAQRNSAGESIEQLARQFQSVPWMHYFLHKAFNVPVLQQLPCVEPLDETRRISLRERISQFREQLPVLSEAAGGGDLDVSFTLEETPARKNSRASDEERRDSVLTQDVELDVTVNEDYQKMLLAIHDKIKAKDTSCFYAPTKRELVFLAIAYDNRPLLEWLVDKSKRDAVLAEIEKTQRSILDQPGYAYRLFNLWQADLEYEFYRQLSAAIVKAYRLEKITDNEKLKRVFETVLTSFSEIVTPRFLAYDAACRAQFSDDTQMSSHLAAMVELFCEKQRTLGHLFRFETRTFPENERLLLQVLPVRLAEKEQAYRAALTHCPLQQHAFGQACLQQLGLLHRKLEETNIRTPIVMEGTLSWEEVVPLFRGPAVDIMSQDVFGNTPLHYALFCQSHAARDLLLELWGPYLKTLAEHDQEEALDKTNRFGMTVRGVCGHFALIDSLFEILKLQHDLTEEGSVSAVSAAMTPASRREGVDDGKLYQSLETFISVFPQMFEHLKSLPGRVSDYAKKVVEAKRKDKEAYDRGSLLAALKFAVLRRFGRNPETILAHREKVLTELAGDLKYIQNELACSSPESLSGKKKIEIFQKAQQLNRKIENLLAEAGAHPVRLRKSLGSGGNKVDMGAVVAVVGPLTQGLDSIARASTPTSGGMLLSPDGAASTVSSALKKGQRNREAAQRDKEEIKRLEDEKRQAELQAQLAQAGREKAEADAKAAEAKLAAEIARSEGLEARIRALEEAAAQSATMQHSGGVVLTVSATHASPSGDGVVPSPSPGGE